MEKKKISVIIASLLLIALFCFTGCFTNGCILNSCTCLGNKQTFDFNYNFNYAIIELPNGKVVEGDIDRWTDYDDGDQIQVTISGVTYLVHSSDCVLISK